MGRLRHFDLGFVSSMIKIVGTCWEWQGDRAQKYPRVSVNGITTKVAKAVWSIANKKPWPGDSHMLHSCDNKRCVNPSHVRPGTHKMNMEDKANRKRGKGGCPAGPNHPLRGRKIVGRKHPGHSPATRAKMSESAKKRWNRD